ncbi:DUF1983 domain-containing protein [Burkholderia ubonensis]|uniref:phage tail tip fiber protein n=1 Tax=Burkholderia ubonensis TaxID=101571 RepID=UPI0039F5FAF2
MFFWVRLVDRSGNVGAFYPDGVGVNGQSSANATLILDLLTDKLTREQFGQELLSEIDSIPEMQASVDDAVKQSNDAAQKARDAAAQASGMADQITAVQASVDAETIARGRAVDSLDQKIASLSDRVGDNAARLQDEATIRADADSSLAHGLRTLTAHLRPQMIGDDGNPFAGDEMYAGVYSEQEARTDGDEALAADIRGVAAQVVTATGELKAMVQDEMRGRVTGDEALADRITTLESNVNGKISAQIQQEQETRATADEALAKSVTKLSTTVEQNAATFAQQVQALTNADAAQVESIAALKAQVGEDIQARITTEAKARADGDGSLATRIDMLTATAGDKNAALQNTLTALATTDAAQATKISQLQASVGTGGDVDTRIKAAIKEQATVQATTDAAQSKRIDDVQAQAGANAAAIQVNANAYADLKGKVNATYSVRVQALSNGQKVMAGWTLNADGSGDSSMVVAASKFMVVDPNGNGLISPFAISNGQVVMSDAIVNNLHVNLALVHGRLQSTAVGSNGRPCVIIDMQSGELSFNGINNGSGWTEISPGRVVVYDGAGRPRVAMGVNI